MGRYKSELNLKHEYLLKGDWDLTFTVLYRKNGDDY